MPFSISSHRFRAVASIAFAALLALPSVSQAQTGPETKFITGNSPAKSVYHTAAYDKTHGAQCVQNTGAYILDIDWYGHDAFWYDLATKQIHVKDANAGSLSEAPPKPVAPLQQDTALIWEVRCWHGDSPAFAVLKVRDANTVKDLSIAAASLASDAAEEVLVAVACVALGLETLGAGCVAAQAVGVLTMAATDVAIAESIKFAVPDPEQLARFQDFDEFKNAFRIVAPTDFGVTFKARWANTAPSSADPNNLTLVSDNLNAPGKMIKTGGSATAPTMEGFAYLKRADWNEFKAHDHGCKNGTHTFHVRCETFDTNEPVAYCTPFTAGDAFVPELYAGHYFTGANTKTITRAYYKGHEGRPGMQSSSVLSLFSPDYWMEVQVSCTPKFAWRFNDNWGNLIAHRKGCSAGKREFHARCEDERGNVRAGACGNNMTVVVSPSETVKATKLNDEWTILKTATKAEC